jgi:uncharacterized membrane protein YdjX (TVP38/TMEM64 family)
MPIFRSARDRKKAIVAVTIVIVVLIVLFLIARFLVDPLASADAMKRFLLDLGPFSPPVFILIQVLQVIFAPIPGQAAGLVSGYVYGAALGTLYTMIGTALGSALAFFLARRFGRPFVEKVIDEKVLKRFDYVSNDKGTFALFLIFLLPVLPDDAVCYIAGLTRIPIWKLLIIAVIGRFPGFLVLNLTGAGFAGANALFAGILFAVMMGLSILLFIFKDRIEKAATSLVDRFRKGDEKAP